MRPSITRAPHLKRYQKIVTVFARHGFGSTLTSLHLDQRIPLPQALYHAAPGLTPAEHFRLALEELGPTFIKVGQILTTRPDLLGPNFIRELTKLQDAVPAEPWEKIREVLVDELGEEPEALFEQIDPVPLAAASLSQVHPAVLKTGESVVIKIQRPDVAVTIETDLAILKELAALAQHTEWGELNRPGEIVEEFAFTLTNELDYCREGRNADRFRANFAGEAKLHIPTIYWDYTTRRVLVMERLKGIKVDDVHGLESAGYNREQVALNAASIIIKEVLQDGFYHADPHGGNLLVMPGEVIGAMDFGMVGELDDRDRQIITRLYIHSAALDADGIVDELIRMRAMRSGADRAHLVRDLNRLLRKYSGLALKDIHVQDLLEDFTVIITRHRLALPPELWLLGKTLGMMEGLGLRLDPEFDIFAISEPIVRQLKIKMLLPDENWKKILLSRGADWGEFTLLFPRASRRLLEKIEQDQPFDVDLHDMDQMLSVLNRLVNRLSLSILIAALVVGLAILIATTADGSPLQILIAVGFIAVVSLGIGLLISILRRR